MNPNKNLAEQEILAGIATGDERSLRALYDQYYNSLLHFAQSLIHDQSQSEDIVIVSFTKFWEQRAGFTDLRAVKSFLYVSIRNSCFRYYNHLQVRDRHLAEVQSKRIRNDDFIESRIIVAEMVQRVHQEIDSLNPKYREIIRLIFIEELSVQQISEQLGITAENVRKRKERALEELRNKVLVSGLDGIVGGFIVLFIALHD